MARTFFPFAVAALALVGPCCSQSVASDNPIDLCRYSLVWSDEFDDLSIGNWRLEGKRWTAHTPWAGDFGDARFLDPGSSPGAFEVRDGVLRITAQRDETGKWTSGLIAAADETGAGSGLRYGYFEARMRVSAGPGTWPAFWLYSLKPRSDPRPNVEFDALEFYGHDPAGYYAAWHVYDKKADGKQVGGDLKRIPISDGSFSKEFHTIGVEVTPAQVTYFFDRKPVWQHDTPKELDTPLFPLADLALGSGYSIQHTPNPSMLQIDYVRIYAPRSAADRRPCDAARGSVAGKAKPDQLAGQGQRRQQDQH